jgi:divalent metal cation (Fe/Co/Zn/Cd) transporter
VNAAFGWWQVDPLIAIAISLSLFHEGWEALRGEAD